MPTKSLVDLVPYKIVGCHNQILQPNKFGGRNPKITVDNIWFL